MNTDENYEQLARLGFIEKEYVSKCISMSQPEIDPKAPYRPVHTGLFELYYQNKVTKRKYCVYVPQTMLPPGAGIFVFSDSRNEPRNVVNDREIIELSEKLGVSIIYLFAPNGWNNSDFSEDLSYANAALADALSTSIYNIGMFYGRQYVFGMGDGCQTAFIFARLHSQRISAIALNTEVDIDEDILSTIDLYYKKLPVNVYGGNRPQSAWIVKKAEKNNIFNYLFSVDKCNNSISSVDRQYYFNDNGAFETAAGRRSDASVIVSSETPTIKNQFEFLVQFRTVYEDGGYIRKRVSFDDLRLKKFEETINDRKREWYLYLPPHSNYEKLPLVVALHGYTGTGEYFAETSEWTNVAARRGFAVLFPCSYPYARKENGSCYCPLPAWNCGIYPRDDNLDDVDFIKQVIEKTCTEFNIDKHRIYATGHSNGSRMTQKLMREYPIFAAYGPVGATETDSEGKPFAIPFENQTLPVWYIMSEFDVGHAARLDEKSDTYKTLDYMYRYMGILDGLTVVTNNYPFVTIKKYNKYKEPLVIFSKMLDMPHAYTPEISHLLWDEFFSCWSTDEDGNAVYLNGAFR